MDRLVHSYGECCMNVVECDGTNGICLRAFVSGMPYNTHWTPLGGGSKVSNVLKCPVKNHCIT